MEYNDVFANIHWGTKNEKREVSSVANQILRNASGFSDVRKPATLLLGGLLKQESSRSYNFDISDIVNYLSDITVSELRKDLNEQLQKAEGNTEEFNRLSDCYHSFLVAGDRKANDILNFLNDGLMKECDRSPIEEHSEELFKAYFDKDDSRVPSYTVNFAELEGFDSFVRDFMCESLLDKMYDMENVTMGNISPENLAKNLLSQKPNGKDFMELLEKQMAERDTDGIYLKNDVNFNVAIGVKGKEREEVIMDAAMRRGTRLLAKTMFFEEGSKVSRSSSDAVSNLIRDLRIKPYTKEPVDLLYKKNPALETFHVRKARKYLYDNFVGKSDLHLYARRILANSMWGFKKGGINTARSYLQSIETNKIYHQDLRDACKYIDKYCLDSERLLTKTRTKEKIKHPPAREVEFAR